MQGLVVMTDKKTAAEIEQFVANQAEFVGDNIALLSVIQKMTLGRIIAAKREAADWVDKRYIKQEELTWTCYYLLEGYSYEEALVKASETAMSEHTELQEACSTSHNRQYLDNMYDTATDDNAVAFRKMRDTGYLTKNDYKGKTRPSTGLKKIERAVQHSTHHSALQSEIEHLSSQLAKTDANMAIKDVEITDIQKYLGIELTTEQKVAILLNNGFETEVICETIGCSKSTVSRVRTKMRGE